MARSPRTRSTGSTTGWRTVTPAPVVLLYGPEEYFVSRARQRLRGLFAETNGTYELTTLSAKDYRIGQLEVVASPSLFDEPKIIEVENVAQMSEAFLADALTYLQAPHDSTLIILHHAGGNRGKKLIDSIKANKAYPVVECKALKNERDRLDFVIHEFRATGRTIDSSAAQALAMASSDIAELASAARQLIADEPGNITVDTIDRYFGGRTEVTAFKVGDAAAAGNRREAIKLLRQALDTGSDPIPILGALAMRMRNIARVYGVRGNAHQLAGDLKMAPWQIEAAQRDSRRFAPADLARVLALLTDTDAQLKGENVDSFYPLEKAVLAISQAARASS
ncbi:DNA polymerase III subunit delta [Rothia nasisuis]|uniref:DNA polymerase III subunit delta n=1 Tax=Rothia nasisuis TaxID=2109647 RepID=UPI001F012DA9|nr:DNA polymerase III subunit delta [Rothia nasisuis]